MPTHRLLEAGKRMLSPAVLCCLWGFAAPADAPAQRFNNATCTVQSVTKDGTTTWQIKGTSTVTGLIADPNSTVKVKVLFQKKGKGDADWFEILDLTLTVAANKGTANIDTNFQNLTPEPAAGDQYRITLSGTWRNPGPPAKKGDLPAADSPSFAPVPGAPRCVPRGNGLRNLSGSEKGSLNHFPSLSFLPFSSFRAFSQPAGSPAQTGKGIAAHRRRRIRSIRSAMSLGKFEFQRMRSPVAGCSNPKSAAWRATRFMPLPSGKGLPCRDRS